jgi:hypothetical protein
MKKFLATMLVSSMCLATACSTSTPTETTAAENITIEAESETTITESEISEETAENGELVWDLNDKSAQEIYDMVIDIIHYDTTDNINSTVESFLEPTPFTATNASIWQGTAEIPLTVTDGDCGKYLSLMNIADDNGNIAVTNNLRVEIGFSFSDRIKAEELYELLGNYYFDHYTQYETPDTEYYMTRDLDDGGWFLDRPGGGGIYNLSLFEENGKYNMSIGLSLGSMMINNIEI